MKKLLIITALTLSGFGANASNCATSLQGNWYCGYGIDLKLSVIRDQNTDQMSLVQSINGDSSLFDLNLGKRSARFSSGKVLDYRAICSNPTEATIIFEEYDYSYKATSSETMVWKITNKNKDATNEIYNCIKM